MNLVHDMSCREKNQKVAWLIDVGRSPHSKWNCAVSAKKVYIKRNEITRAKLVAKATTGLPFLRLNKNRILQ